MRYLYLSTVVSLLLLTMQGIAQDLPAEPDCPNTPPVVCRVDGLPFCEVLCGTVCIEAMACDDKMVSSLAIEIDGIEVASGAGGWVSYDLDLGDLPAIPHFVMIIATDEYGEVGLEGVEILPVDIPGGLPPGFTPAPIESGECNLKGAVFEDTNGDELPDAPLPNVYVGLYNGAGSIAGVARTNEDGMYQFRGISCNSSYLVMPMTLGMISAYLWTPAVLSVPSIGEGTLTVASITGRSL